MKKGVFAVVILIAVLAVTLFMFVDFFDSSEIKSRDDLIELAKEYDGKKLEKKMQNLQNYLREKPLDEVELSIETYMDLHKDGSKWTKDAKNIDVSLERDPLIMMIDRNAMVYNNCDAVVKFDYDFSEDKVLTEEEYDEFCDEYYRLFSDCIESFYLTKSVQIVVVDENGNEKVMTPIGTGHKAALEDKRDRGLLEIRNFAYDYALSLNDNTMFNLKDASDQRHMDTIKRREKAGIYSSHLSRFGINADGDFEIQIEILEPDYRIEWVIILDEIAKVADDLANKILKEKAYVDYLKGKNVSTMNIKFLVRDIDENECSFSYDIE